jgi:hypothetical protein
VAGVLALDAGDVFLERGTGDVFRELLRAAARVFPAFAFAILFAP